MGRNKINTRIKIEKMVDWNGLFKWSMEY